MRQEDGASHTPDELPPVLVPHPDTWGEFARALGPLDLTLLPCLPDFLIISPSKTGSTWLFGNLRCHPDLFMPPEKELKYFCLRWPDHDLNWYLAHFREGVAKIKGEASPSYATLPESAIETLSLLVPKVRLVFLMRDPVSRAWSHVKHFYRHRMGGFSSFLGPIDSITDAEWLAHAAHPWIATFDDYLGCLRRWLRYFPKDQLLVDFYESIADSPQELLARIFEHLGVSPRVDWSRFPISERVLSGHPKRIPAAVKRALAIQFDPIRDQLSAFLRDEFSLEIPPQWTRLPADAVQPGHPTPAAPAGRRAAVAIHSRAHEEDRPRIGGALTEGTGSTPGVPSTEAPPVSAASPPASRPTSARAWPLTPRPGPPGKRHFVITSNRRSSTSWLASTLNRHPAVVCSHGHGLPPVVEYPAQAPDEQALRAPAAHDAFLRRTLDEVFEELEAAADGLVYGLVGAYSAHELYGQRHLNHPQCRCVALNLIRHPETRIDSLKRRLLHEMRHHPAGQPALIGEFDLCPTPDLLTALGKSCHVDLTLDDSRAFTLATCLVLAHDLWDFSTPIPHIPIEQLASDPEYFAAFFGRICQGLAEADEAYLSQIFAADSVNAEAEERSPVGQVAAWEEWQRVFFSGALQRLGLEPRYRALGYNLHFLVGREAGDAMAACGAALEALQRKVDEGRNRTIPEVVEDRYRGFSLARFGQAYYALSLALGSIDLAALDEAAVRAHEATGKLLHAPSLEALKRRVVEEGYRATPEVVEEGYRGFNLARFGQAYYALSLALGTFNLAALDEAAVRAHEATGKLLRAASLEALKRKVDQEGYRATPELVEEGYHGFNLARLGQAYYALSLALGHFDLAAQDEGAVCAHEATGMLVRAASLEELKRRLDTDAPRGESDPPESASPAIQPGVTPLAHYGFNIVQAGRYAYGFAEGLGPVDPTGLSRETLERYQRAGLCVVAESIQDLRHLIDSGAYLLGASRSQEG